MDQNRSKKAKPLKSTDSKPTNKKKPSKSTSKSINKTKSESKKEVAQPEPKKTAEPLPVNNNPSFRENKVPVKLDLISKQIEKSEEILFNQNKVLSRVGELTSKITYLDKNFESIYYKSDVEDFNAKLVNNDESLQNVLGNLKYFNKDLENTKYLQEQNKNLKYKLEICEVEKEDKNLFYENKLNSFESQLGGEIYDFFGFLKNLNLNVAYNTPSINAKNLDDNQIVLFFATVKQILKALKHKHEDKEKDLSIRR